MHLAGTRRTRGAGHGVDHLTHVRELTAKRRLARTRRARHDEENAETGRGKALGCGRRRHARRFASACKTSRIKLQDSRKSPPPRTIGRQRFWKAVPFHNPEGIDVLQPRVARYELPWVCESLVGNPEGIVPIAEVTPLCEARKLQVPVLFDPWRLILPQPIPRSAPARGSSPAPSSRAPRAGRAWRRWPCCPWC